MNTNKAKNSLMKAKKNGHRALTHKDYMPPKLFQIVYMSRILKIQILFKNQYISQDDATTASKNCTELNFWHFLFEKDQIIFDVWI